MGPIDTRACRFELDPRGFVRATIRQGIELDLADAREALAATGRLGGGRPVPVLVDSRGIKYQTKEARDHLISPEAERVSCAVALLVGSPVSRMIGSFFLRNHHHPSPTQMFTEEAKAVEWLRGYLG